MMISNDDQRCLIISLFSFSDILDGEFYFPSCLKFNDVVFTFYCLNLVAAHNNDRVGMY